VHKEPQDGAPKILHYTDGGPWFKEHINGDYADVWFDALNKFKAEQKSS